MDHSWGPKPRRVKKGDDWVEEPYIPTNNCAPKLIEGKDIKKKEG